MFLFDEPLSNLDAKLWVQVRGEIKELADGQSTPIERAPSAYIGRNVIFGVRPEDIHLDPKDGFPCPVSLVEPVGSETHLLARAGETEIVVVLRERIAIRDGETVRLSLGTTRAHFFDPDSGQRVSLD